MIKEVMLSIRGTQSYPGQEPDGVELVTDGTLEDSDTGWILSYQESDLTGMDGVTTTFRILPGRITLVREGKLRSEMVFQEGERNESLYQMEFGALLMCVTATKVAYDISEQGGTVDLKYSIEIEHSVTGFVEYHLDIKVRES